MNIPNFFPPLVSAFAMLAIAGCATSNPAPERPSSTASLERHPEISPVKDSRALKELKVMAGALSNARTLGFTVMTMKPLHGPNDQWVHVLTTDSVELERPNKLYVVTGGDAYPQKIYFNAGRFAIDAPEAKLYTAREMSAKDVDGMLAEASHVGGLSLPFADVLLSDPLPTWEKDLEGAIFVGESNRNSEKLNHIALTAGDVNWEIWIDQKTHLPRLVHVKYLGEHRAPSVMMEFSHWKVNGKFKSADFAFKAPSGAKQVSLVAPGEGK